MRYIIFSDLHSNLEALIQFEKEIERINHDKLVCLGDIVGYGVDPNACVQWVRDNVDFTVAGNHDLAVVELTDTKYFNPYAYDSCLWTRNELTEENKEYLRSLPLDCQERDVYWVHSSPFEPEAWHYVTSQTRGERFFRHFESPFCFVGHSHKPVILEQAEDGGVTDFVLEVFKIKPSRRYIFNCGSLGQPRDGNQDPSFIVYDTEEKKVSIHRFQYDFCSTQAKILEHGLPPFLAERLARGK